MQQDPAFRKQSEMTLSRLPPLTALRAFTATARHLSFIRAAEELHVTPAAVGQHVRQLEVQFGRPLFLRNRGRLELTDEGRTLFPELHRAFEMVVSAISRAGESSTTAQLRISAPLSFISKWLVPRLADIQNELPDVRIVLQREGDFAVDDGDRPGCAVRLAGEGTQGADADYLFQEETVAVCTPSYRLRYDLSEHDLGLDRVTLFEEVRHERDSLYPGWDKWLAVNGNGESLPTRRISLTDASMVIDAALSGQGVGLTSLRLAQHELATGRLIIPFGISLPTRDAYFFAAFDASAPSSPTQVFRRWLLREAAAARSPAHPRRDYPLAIAAE